MDSRVHFRLNRRNLSRSGKQDFLKSYRSENGIYQGPYNDPILSAVRRNFNNSCKSYDVLKGQRMSVQHVMFSADADRYFTEHVAPHAPDEDDAFKCMYDHFMTPSHKDRYTIEWNTLSFLDIKRKITDKSTSRCLDILFQRALDLQSLLDYAYQSPLLLRECVIKAVKSESLYAPLMVGEIPGDQNTLHTRLHQFTRQIQTTLPVTSNSKGAGPLQIFFTEEREAEDSSDLEVLYNAWGQPYFK